MKRALRRNERPSIGGFAYRSKKSSALVIVLGCLALISILMVAFLASIGTERKSAQFYANGSSVKLLADSAVSVVMGQIKDATKGTDGSGATLAWASQPGMIRTYGTTGQAASYYKLYSWAGMVGSGAFTPFASTETPPTTWMNSPALYTDLNDPVSGVYPVVDPSASGVVQGFSLSSAPVSTTDAAPMPVQWLYVLQDGSLATATGSAGTTADVASATSDNPIVGRIAFWTDDDTCKVNINTAAGDVWTSSSSPPSPGQPGNPGSFWDIPRVFSSFEKTNLSMYQPAQAEYQRYPGHPATTYLSAVFPNYLTNAASIDQIVPRIVQGGSLGGTTFASAGITPDSDRLYASVDELIFDPTRVGQPSPATKFTASTIEQAKFFLTAHSRAPEVNLFNEPRVVIWPESSINSTTYRTAYDSLIAYCGSLVCTNSISGALTANAYYFQRNQTNAAGAAITTGSDSPTDDLPTTATATGVGRNRSLITYLRNLTSLSIPGFSKDSSDTFVNKYPLDRDEILTEIFDYIRAVNSQDRSVSPFSPYTPVLASKNSLSPRQGQIVPITDNVHSDSNGTTLRGFGRFPTVREASLLFVGIGQTAGALTNVPPTTNPNASLNTTTVADGKTRVQAMFYLSFFDPNQGYAATCPNFNVRVSNLNAFQWSTNGAPTASSMGFGSTGTVAMTKTPNSVNFGGYQGASPFVSTISPVGNASPSGGTPALFSIPFDFPTTSSATPTTFLFKGGDAKVEILDDSSAQNVLQTLTIHFPDGTFPVPYLAPQLRDTTTSFTGATNDYRNFTAWSGNLSGTSPNTYIPVIGGRFTGTYVSSVSTSTKMWVCGKDVIRSVVVNTDPRLIAARTNVPSAFFSEIEPQYSDPTVMQINALAESENGGGARCFAGCLQGKFVADANYGSPGGAGLPVPLAAVPAKGNDYTTTGTMPDGLQPIAVPGNVNGPTGYAMPIAFGMNGSQCNAVNGVTAGSNSSSTTSSSTPGDWDTGLGQAADGPFVNKADEGTIAALSATAANSPYFENTGAYTAAGGTFFTPNRQIPSAVMFGSLPTGIMSSQPWQTLLFRPDPGGTPQHIGAKSPQDHLLLDLFNMPVVEPYAISDPFSTAGKINMNYEIVPFTYITRSTGIRAVLKPEQLLALKNTDTATYKIGNFANRRVFLDLDQTLTGFQNRFNTGDIFRSASEICNIWLIPQGQTYSDSGMQTYWSTSNPLSGDNVKERPYGDIYPRLTTKSNTFTVHYRVQTLKKLKSNQVNQWVEGSDIVTAEYRGSSTVERYLDTSDTTIPDYATEPQPLAAGKAIDNFYKFRVIETKQFTP